MIFILLFTILLFFHIRHNVKSQFRSPYILSPDNIVLLMFMLSCFVACVDIGQWGDISVGTYFVVTIALLSLVIGSSFGLHRNISSVSDFRIESLDIPKIWNISVIVFMIIITYFQYVDMLILVGKSGLGIMALSLMARESIYAEDFSIDHPFYVWQGLYISKAFVYIFIFVICYQKIILKKKVSLLKYIPILIYIIQIILSTGRSDFIYLIYSVLIVSYILMTFKIGSGKKIETRFIKYMLLSLVVFLCVFLSLSNARNEGHADFSKTISTYVGSSIPAYNMYLENNGYNSTATNFGEQTLILYYSIGNAFKFTDVKGVDTLPPVTISGEVTNIYTALYRYTHDYGVIFMFIIVFIIGFLYSKFFYRVINKRNYVSIVLYSFLSYPIVEFSIEERLMSTLISARTVFICLYIIILFKIVVNIRKKRNINC